MLYLPKQPFCSTFPSEGVYTQTTSFFELYHTSARELPTPHGDIFFTHSHFPFFQFNVSIILTGRVIEQAYRAHIVHAMVITVSRLKDRQNLFTFLKEHTFTPSFLGYFCLF